MDELLMDDRELAVTVLQAFLEDTPRQIETLKEHAAAGDIRKVERGAHTIKGAAANIGAERLRLIAYEMELRGKADDLPSMQQKLPELEESFRELRDVLERKIGGARTSG